MFSLASHVSARPWNASVAGPVTVGTPPYTLWMLTNIFISTTPLPRSESGYGVPYLFTAPLTPITLECRELWCIPFCCTSPGRRKGSPFPRLLQSDSPSPQTGLWSTTLHSADQSDQTELCCPSSNRDVLGASGSGWTLGSLLPQPSCCHVLFSLPRVLPILGLRIP